MEKIVYTMILKFLKRYINYFVITLTCLNLLSCCLNKFCIEYLINFLVFSFTSILFTFLEVKILHKGFISDKSVGILCFSFVISLIFLILSFIYKDRGYTNLSISAATAFLIPLIIIKHIDINEDYYIFLTDISVQHIL